MIVQFLPESPERMRRSDIPGGDAPEGIEFDEYEDDAWAETKALASTIEDSELTDPRIGVEGLLYRLFNERGVRIYPGIEVLDDCACSQDKIRGVLKGFSAEEILDSVEDGKIEVRCEFCSTTYVFEPEEFGV
jgi:molecular chaperone Hsp33